MAETALVTGATSGIGASLCLLLASDGYNLVTVARDEEALQKQAGELKLLDVDVLPVACDLSEPDAAGTIFKRVQDAGLEVDILVNDAGYSAAGSFAELPEADVRAMIQVSITSLAELTNLFVKPMLERGRGRILNMSSMMAKTPCPYNALYGASKVFVFSFTAALAYELRGTGVSATTVCPGATRTNFPKNAGIEDAPAWKYFSTDADASAIGAYRALMRNRPCAVTGWYNKIGAFSTRFMPLAFQVMTGDWLLGDRKHPLDHEGDERPNEEDGKEQPAEHGEAEGDAKGQRAEASPNDRDARAEQHGPNHERAGESDSRATPPDGKPADAPSPSPEDRVSPFVRVSSRPAEQTPQSGPSCNTTWNRW